MATFGRKLNSIGGCVNVNFIRRDRPSANRTRPARFRLFYPFYEVRQPGPRRSDAPTRRRYFTSN